MHVIRPTLTRTIEIWNLSLTKMIVTTEDQAMLLEELLIECCIMFGNLCVSSSLHCMGLQESNINVTIFVLHFSLTDFQKQNYSYFPDQIRNY